MELIWDENTFKVKKKHLYKFYNLICNFFHLKNFCMNSIHTLIYFHKYLIVTLVFFQNQIVNYQDCFIKNKFGLFLSVLNNFYNF